MNFEKMPVDFGDNYLWKYMDIHKFLYLIREKKLFFTRLDGFEDSIEGASEELLRDRAKTELFLKIKNPNPAIYPNEDSFIKERNKYIEYLKEIDEEILFLQKQQYASCWFLSERESYAMWKLYSNPESVAVRFKPSLLLEEIERSVQNHPSHLYVDKIVGNVVEYRPLWPFEFDMSKYVEFKQEYVGLRKDTSFSSENEYRLLAIKSPNVGDHPCFELKLEGLFDLDFKIVTHPKMQVWMHDNIASVLKTYGIENKLMKSEIWLRNAQ